MESHLLDGMLSRSLFLGGLILYFSPVADRWYFANVPINKVDHRLSIWGLGLLFSSLGIALFATVLEAAEPDFQQKLAETGEFSRFAAWVLPVLESTAYGRTWCLTLLTVCGFCLTRLWELRKQKLFFSGWQVSGELWAAYLFTRLGHGGAFSLSSPWLWMQTIHVAALILWLASLGVFARHVFSNARSAVLFLPKRFARTMHFTMAAILLSGVARAAALWPASCDFFAQPYVLLLGLKVGIVLLLLGFAYSLRQRLQRKEKCSPAQLQQIFSLEILTAALLVFFSNLLSQLPPP